LDYNIGEDIKEKLIPRAIDWYTGAALEYEEIDEDDLPADYDDEFSEDDDEDEDEDEDEDDDEQSDKPKQEPAGMPPEGLSLTSCRVQAAVEWTVSARTVG
jgi:nucleosome assembly protein 1-like 1